jgi:lysophospholipase L1-like esterase
LATWPEIKQINEGIQKMADGQRVFFVNVNDRFAGPDGILFDGLTVDKLHPSVQGYQIWADGLRPHLIKWLGQPATTDHAPAPTGDPHATHPAVGS